MKKNNENTYALPVNLLLSGRLCLVVGAGKVALRKTGNLLAAGARVRLVAPQRCEGFNPLIEDGSIEYLEREFEAGDVEQATLVFACTDDRSVNREVLEACRDRKILCSCVDGNWRSSDFTTPATMRHDNLTVTVSTGGQSCRQAKLVKNSLARHIESIESADLMVVGTDHRHMPLEEREPYHLSAEKLERTGSMIMQLWGVHEFMLLNTCNRIEIMAVVSREAGANGILRHALGFDTLNEQKYYLKRGEEAWGHAALVCSGMLSQTPGESHIAGQVKRALRYSVDQGWADGMLKEWISTALHASKHIKNEVVPNIPACEMEELALHYLAARDPDLKRKTLMVLGAGGMGRNIVCKAGPIVRKIIWCYHLQKPALPAEHKDKIELCTFNSIKERLCEADALISATDSPGYLLRESHAPFINQEEAICLLDLGVPRNIDPKLADLPMGVDLIDLDDLKHWHRNELVGMETYIDECRRIIRNEQGYYKKLINSFQGGNA